MKEEFFFKIFPSAKDPIFHIFDVVNLGSGCTVRKCAIKWVDDFHRHLELIPSELHETLILTYLNQIKDVPNCYRLGSEEILHQLIINATLFEVLDIVTHEDPYDHLCNLTDDFKSECNYLEVVRSAFNVDFIFSGYIESPDFKNKVQNFLKFPFFHQNSMKECSFIRLDYFRIENLLHQWHGMDALARLGGKLDSDTLYTPEEGASAYIKLIEDLFHAVRSTDVQISRQFDLEFFVKDKVYLVDSSGKALAEAECSGSFVNWIEPSGYITCYYVMESYLNLVICYILDLWESLVEKKLAKFQGRDM